MAKTKELFYAVIGTGDLAIDKVKGVKKFADRKNNEKLYRDVVKRGRTISTKVRTSSPGKQVKAQTQNVRKQATDAAKNVTKALGVSGVSWPKGRKPATKTTTKSAPRKTTAAKAS